MTTKKSQQITDLDAGLKVAVGLLGGRQRVAAGTVALATGDLDAADIILLTRVPSNARVLSILLFNDDLGTVLTVDVGLYNTDGTVKDDDAYSEVVALDVANEDGQEVAYDAAAGSRGIEELGQRVFEDAGDASDPGGLFDIGLTVVTSTTPAAGDLSWIVTFVVD